jgi:peptidyl-prolyl cis-trans isomerase SurA
MRKTLFLVAIIAVAIFATSLFADSVVEEIIARVNDDIITRAELQRNKQQLLDEAKQKGATLTDAQMAEREKDVLRDLIDQQLLIQKAKDLGITGDAEVVKRLDQIRQDMKLNSMEELEQAAQQQGMNFEDFKQGIRNSIITQQVISREVGSHISIPPDEIAKFYELNKKQFEGPEQVQIAELLIAPAKDEKGNPKEDQASLDAAKAKAESVLTEIKKGMKFADAAAKYSDGPTAAQGGDLGLFKRGTLSKDLEDVTFNMKAGETSNVIRTKQGFVILKVIEHQSAGIPPMKEVEPQIQEAIYLEKLQPALRAYLTKLREDSYIDIKAGFVDTGASPNQTKPIMTASSTATDDAAKAKKKKKKFVVF